MSKVYAIAVDTFCGGESIRGSYTIVRAPFDEEASAAEELDDVISELEDRYKSLETVGQNILSQSVDENTRVLIREKDGVSEPILRCSVLGVDMSAITSVQKHDILKSGCSKKATEEQKKNNKMFKKISQYVATLTPETLHLQ